jgi:hypothetical protein
MGQVGLTREGNCTTGCWRWAGYRSSEKGETCWVKGDLSQSQKKFGKTLIISCIKDLNKI